MLCSLQSTWSVHIHDVKRESGRFKNYPAGIVTALLQLGERHPPQGPFECFAESIIQRVKRSVCQFAPPASPTSTCGGSSIGSLTSRRSSSVTSSNDFRLSHSAIVACSFC